MTLKIFILTICIAFGLSQIWGQTEMIVNFIRGEKVSKTKEFRFYLTAQYDTLKIFSSSGFQDNKQKKNLIPVDKDTVLGVFEFTSDFKVWQKVEQLITIEKGLKRIEIDLYFSTNDRKVEFLQDYTVNKFYHTDNVIIQSVFKKTVGTQPVFMLINNSDTTFWGNSPTNHFYGTIKSKTDVSWYAFSGSYCTSAIPEKPLYKTDTVYSWIPNYDPGDEYIINRSGTYKYLVALSLEQYSEGIPTKLIEQGQTRKRTRILYEVETEFKIE